MSTDQVRLCQSFTLGALSPKHSLANPDLKRHPTIENNVTVYAGATILGDVVVGKESIIGENGRLNNSTPTNSRVFMKDADSVQEKRVKAN